MVQPQAFPAPSQRIRLWSLLRPQFLFILSFAAFFGILPNSAAAAGSVPATREPERPRVTFDGGLITVDVTDGRLGPLLSQIGQQAGIKVSLGEGLGNKSVTVHFENLPIETGLKAILRSAGVVNHALQYRQSQKRGKIGQWVVEKIYLKEKGMSTGVPSAARVAAQPAGKTGIEKEPFFDKKLDRFVEVVKGEVLIRFKKGLPEEEISKLVRELGATVVKRNEKLGTYRLRIPDSRTVSEFLDQHGRNENLVVAEPNFIAATMATLTPAPNDPLLSSQWAIRKIEADKAWQITTGSPDVVVAVIDTGIEMTHEDLRNKVLPGTDIVNDDPDPSDDHGHGTHVAGIIAAETNNSVGIAGISWNSQLLPVKVITASGEGAYSDVIDGVVYAADNGARVLNLSIGGYSYSQVLGDAVEYAHNNGAVLVAAGGNEDSSEPIYPAAYPNVIGVSATDSADHVWPSSNQGTYIKISAPGTDILSTAPNGGYARATGTSASAAHVAGLAMLILSKTPHFSNTQVEQILYQTADELGEKGWDQDSGYGRLNAAKALEVASIDVHDLAITRIRVEPQTFQIGEPTQIIVTAQNQGTSVETDRAVSASVNDMSIEDAKKIKRIKPGESIDVSFSWVPSVTPAEETAFKVKGEIGPVQGEIDLDDNVRTRNFVGTLQDGRVQIEHKIDPQVHQWLAGEAFNLLPSGPMNTEVYQFIGDKTYSLTYPDMNGIFRSTKGYADGTATNDPNDKMIIRGARDDDVHDFYGVYQYANGFYHGWEPDTPQDALIGGNFNDGFAWADSAFIRAQDLWDNYVIHNYRLGDSYHAKAYYYLGHVVHLMGDMGVPAHTHLDYHLGNECPIVSCDDENYEEYPAKFNDAVLNDFNYKQYTSSLASGPTNYNIGYEDLSRESTPNPSDTTVGNWINHGWPKTSWESQTSLFHLFYSMAEISDNYESDNLAGESPSHSDGHDNCSILDTSCGLGDVSWSETKRHADALFARNMEHIAALYKLFWDTTHFALRNGIAVADDVSQGTWKYYSLDVPLGATGLTVETYNAPYADVDLYVKFNQTPTSGVWDCRPYTLSGNETCTISNPSHGTWIIGVRGAASGQLNYALKATYTSPSPVSVTWVSSPPSAMVSGQSYTVSWTISGATSIQHGNVHWHPTDPAANIPDSTCASVTNCWAPLTGIAGTTIGGALTLTAPAVTSPTSILYAVHTRVDNDGINRLSAYVPVTISPPITETTGPTTSNLTASPNPTNGATLLTVRSTVSDTASGNSNIAAAELFIDSPGTSGFGFPMFASDGSFNTATEQVEAIYSISAWVPGTVRTVYVHGKDAAGNWGAFQSVLVTVTGTSAAPTIVTSSPLPSGVVNTFYSQTLQATGGSTAYSWSVVSGSLPPGLGSTSSTGVISGTPTIANTYNFRIRVTGSDGLFSEKDFSLTINSAQPTTRTLTVASANPSSGVIITVSPSDNNNMGDGTTQFSRTYNSNTLVSLTAPSTAGGNNFQKWQRNGVDWSTSLPISLTMDADYTMTAVYALPAGIVTLATGLSNPTDITVDDTSVYWTEYGSGTVKKVSKSGGSATTLVSGLYSVSGLTLDNKYIYFTENVGSGAANIKKVLKSGGSVTTLASGQTSAWKIAVDGVNVYWTDGEGGTIRKVPINGGSVSTLATGSLSASGIAVDSTAVYWSEFTNPGSVKKVPLNGGSVTTLANNSNTPGIAVDSTNVYWTESVFTNSGKVNKVPVNGGSVASLATGLTSPWDVAVDGTNAYWVEYFSGGTVKQAPVNGGSIIILASGLDAPVAIAIDSTNVYWIERSGGGVSGTLKSVAKGTSIADTTAPTVTITSPTSSSTDTTTSENIYLAGTASDNAGVTQVTWVNDRGGSGTAIGTTNWSINGITLQSGSNVLTVTAVDAANNTGTDILTVTYNPVQTFTLTVAKAGTGSGTVTSSPAGINCGATCQGSFNSGQVVTLMAVAGSGSTFAGWSGDADCSDGIVSMNTSKTCTATFGLTGGAQTYTLTLTKAGNGSGMVTSSPSGINCGGSCQAAFNSGETVTLTAAGDSDSTFGSWGDACSGTGTCTVTMDANKSVTATFTASRGLKGEYYDNVDLTDLKLTRVDSVIDLDWGTGTPDPAVGSDTFSVRWTGRIKIDHDETYTFTTLTDEGGRLWIDGHLVIDHWQTGAASNNGSMALTAGWHDIKMEFFEQEGEAFVHLRWFSASTPEAVIPQDHLLPPEFTGSAPTLSWAAGTGYGSDGLDPQAGSTAAVFTYRVKYADPDGSAPMSGYPRVHILKSGQEISGSPFAMAAEGGGSYIDGVVFRYQTILADGSGYTYYFDAKDSTGLQAVASPIAPTPTAPLAGPQVGDLPPLVGDIDGSGRVDGFDLGRLGLAFGSRPGDASWDASVDLNGDGVIDGADLTLLAASFGMVR